MSEHQLREIRLLTDPKATLRTEFLMGREYLVAPMVMIQEGVLFGANARSAEFCPGDELAKLTVQWNGRPTVLGHPQVQGVYVSANSPEILKDWSFGAVYNTTYDGATKKLKAEAWIDVARATELGGQFKDTLDRINAGEEPVEVSTGLYTDIIPEEGTYEGKRYNGRWAGIVSDHLAILPNAQGACSVADGCGIPRINATGETHMRTYTSSEEDCECGGTCGHCGGHDHMAVQLTDEEKANMVRAQQILAVQGLAGSVMIDDAYSILSRAISTKYGKDNSYDYAYLTTLSSEVAIFCAWTGGWSEMKTYSVNYNMDDKGNVSFTSEPKEVLLMSQVNPAPTVAAAPTEGSGQSSTVSSPPGQEMTPVLEDPNTQEEDDATQASRSKNVKDYSANSGGEPAAVLETPAQPKVQTMQEFLASAPPEVRALIEDSLKVHADQKQGLIAEIKASKANGFTDEQLNSFNHAMLQNLAVMARATVTTPTTTPTTPTAPTVDYSGRGGAPVVSEVTTSEEPKVHADTNDFGAPSAPKVFEGGNYTRPRPGAFNDATKH